MENGKIKFIVAHGEKVQVCEVLELSEYHDGTTIDIEFIDERGKYRHYSSWIDGGKVIREK